MEGACEEVSQEEAAKLGKVASTALRMVLPAQGVAAFSGAWQVGSAVEWQRALKL